MIHPAQCVKLVATAERSHLLLAFGPKLFYLAASSEGRYEPVGTWTSPNTSYILEVDATADGAHVVLTTSEDKNIVVLALQPTGELLELSRRTLAKRPSALLISPDGKTVICGDKFGDVFSVPLEFSAEEAKQLAEQACKKASASTPEAAAEPGEQQEQQSFQPTASTSTVHTAANRRALESQMFQKRTAAAPREEMSFPHKLLLGHVSLLTDICWAVRQEDESGLQRNYLVSADRDEHIRVSRAPPQAHVTETYCLGHTSFVNKLCLVDQDRLLVSGGGDDHVVVWDWLTGRAVGQVDFRAVVKEAGLLTAADEGEEAGIVISGLDLFVDQSGKEVLLVSILRTSAVWAIPVAALLSPDARPIAIPVSGSVLSVTSARGSPLYISTAGATEAEPPRIVPYALAVDGDSVKCEEVEPSSAGLSEALEKAGAYVELADKQKETLEQVLFSAESLRKRINEDFA